jgi:hypothetical protein
MKRWLAASAGALFVVAVILSSSTLQAATKTASGTVAAVSGDSLTVKAKDAELKLTIDSKTTIVGKGAGTKSAKMKEENKSPKITDFVKTGDIVTVKYDDQTKLASEVRLSQPTK